MSLTTRLGALLPARGPAENDPAPTKIKALPPRSVADWVAAGLLQQGYVELSPVAGQRVFHKAWSYYEYMFLTADGRLSSGETANPQQAALAHERTVDRLALKGCAVLAAA